MLARELEDRATEAVTLNNIASAYTGLGEYQKALDAYIAALELNRSLDNQWNVSINLNNIAWVYGQLGDRQHALNFYQKSLELIRKVNDQRRIAATLNNIAAIHAELGTSARLSKFITKHCPPARDGRCGWRGELPNNLADPTLSWGHRKRRAITSSAPRQCTGALETVTCWPALSAASVYSIGEREIPSGPVVSGRGAGDQPRNGIRKGEGEVLAELRRWSETWKSRRAQCAASKPSPHWNRFPLDGYESLAARLLRRFRAQTRAGTQDRTLMRLHATAGEGFEAAPRGQRTWPRPSPFWRCSANRAARFAAVLMLPRSRAERDLALAHLAKAEIRKRALLNGKHTGCRSRDRGKRTSTHSPWSSSRCSRIRGQPAVRRIDPALLPSTSGRSETKVLLTTTRCC